MLPLDDEVALRLDAMAWLTVRTNDGNDPITRQQLTEYRFRGERLTLIDTGRGIRKPQKCRAALTIMTVHTPDGQSRPYEDVEGPDGHPRYKMRADARGSSDNRAVIAALELKLPVIWLVGIAPGLFQTIFPVYIIAFEPELDQFVLAYDPAQSVSLPDSPIEAVLKRYLLQETRQRVHQPVFRSMVLHAYRTQCSVCSLRHSQLIDAAHIVPDSDEAGIAAVRNGISLCKIHHAAYDAGILGITPGYGVRIREDVLAEIDGPLFEHGIKGLHGRDLMIIPERRASRPDPELLAWRYQRFLSA